MQSGAGMELSSKQLEQMRQMAIDFEKAMKIRSGLNLRVAQRVTLLLRIGTVSLAVIVVIFLLILWVMTTQMSHMSKALNTMNIRFTVIAKDLADVQNSVMKMRKNVASLPVISGELESVQSTTATLNRDLEVIFSKLSVVDHNMNKITSNIGDLSHSLHGLDWSVQGIGGNVHRLSRPMKFFNSYSPLP